MICAVFLEGTVKTKIKNTFFLLLVVLFFHLDGGFSDINPRDVCILSNIMHDSPWFDVL